MLLSINGLGQSGQLNQHSTNLCLDKNSIKNFLLKVPGDMHPHARFSRCGKNI